MMTYKVSNGMWFLRMVSRFINPAPRPRQVDETPSYDPDAPSFDLMKRQVGKTSATMTKKVFRTTGQGRKSYK
jgi:hypothetical protein